MTPPFNSHTQFRGDDDAIEALSAYLDGETDATERQRVEQWLQADPQARQRLQRMQALRRGLRSLPVPAPTQSPERVADAIFAKTEARRRNAWLWGSTAVAAAVVAAVSATLPMRFQAPEVARSPQTPVFLPTRVSPSPEAIEATPANTERAIVRQALFVE